MAQGNSNESKLKLNAIQPRASSHRSKSIKTQDLLAVSEAVNGKLLTRTQDQSGLPKAKRPLTSFDSIRDPHKSMVLLIDTMFDLLQVHIYETKSDTSGITPQFLIQRPSLEKQTSKKSWLNTASEESVFIGKIYTSDWSLILKGTSEIVLCYVIPSDRVISFNSDPEIYRPYLTINSFKKASSFGWQIDGQTITYEHLPQLTAKLFDKFLKSMRNQEWNESTLALPSINGGVKSAELTGSNGRLEAQSRHDPEQILIELMQAAKEAAPKADEFKYLDKESNPVASPVADSNKIIEISKTDQSFEQTLQLMLTLIDPKLEQLVSEGAQALNSHDFRAAQSVLNLTNELDNFKKKAIEIMAALDSTKK